MTGSGTTELRVAALSGVPALERLPWPAKAVLGGCCAALAVALTVAVHPLHAFPLLLGVPAVILGFWYFDNWGGLAAALVQAVLVQLFLTSSQSSLLLGQPAETLRIPLFLAVTISLGWTLRRLAQQRAELVRQELENRLLIADAERRLAEERAHATEALRDRDALLQVALDANGMGLWVWDLEQNRAYWSDEMYRMAGYTPGSIEPTFEVWAGFVLPEDKPRLAEAIRRATENGKDYREQYRVRMKDGTVHWLESQGKCQRNNQGRVTRVVGVIADVTPRHRAEEAMLRAEKLAVAGRLAASVAHEINNPLEAVSNLLFLITLSETTESAREHARVALEQLMRVSLITQQTLKFHRQSGTPSNTRLSEIIENVRVLFGPRLTASGIQVNIRSKEEVDVNCMPSEAQQIFANLMANAIEAMPKGGRLQVRLRSSRDWRDGKTPGMRITFADTGTGVDRATMRQIFEPFFTTKAETGTGLGLWVVAQLVERHGGQVRVWSRRRAGSSGTAFSVFLPLNEAGIDHLADSATLQAPALGIEA
jgi:PAS domain S-box-containing protein